MARYPSAIWRPTSKQGYGSDNQHLFQGAVVHSMDGSLAAGFGVLDSTTRQASWHFSIANNGQVYQHVDTNNISWTSGSYQANKKFWGIECEGAGTPLTAAQLQAVGQLLAWLWATHGTQGGFVRRVTLWEHNEMTIFGSAPTACPSGRVIWPTIIAVASGGASPPGGGTFLAALTEQQQQEMYQRMVNTDALDDQVFARVDACYHALFDEVAPGVRRLDAITELWNQFAGFKIGPQHVGVPSAHLGEDQGPWVGMNSRDEILLRIRDLHQRAGHLVRQVSTGKVFIITEQGKRWITNPIELEFYTSRGDPVADIDDPQAAAIPDVATAAVSNNQVLAALKLALADPTILASIARAVNDDNAKRMASATP